MFLEFKLLEILVYTLKRLFQEEINIIFNILSEKKDKPFDELS
jgi:hypothetical protein